MKKIIFIGMMISFLNVFSQNFVGNDVELLIGKELKVLENKGDYGYNGFYKKVDFKKIYKKESYNTKKEALSNKTFKVVSFEKYKNSINSTRYKLEIENNEIGTLYYDYNPASEFEFPFEIIGGIKFPEGYFCKDIIEDKDKFSDKVTYRSPYSLPVSYIKNKGDDSLYMSLEVFGSTINIDIKGVVILLENGEKISRPNAKISSKVSNNGRGYIYRAFISLKNEEIEKLTKSNISDIKLYIYETEIKKGGLIKNYLNCIIKK